MAVAAPFWAVEVARNRTSETFASGIDTTQNQSAPNIPTFIATLNAACATTAGNTDPLRLRITANPQAVAAISPTQIAPDST